MQDELCVMCGDTVGERGQLRPVSVPQDGGPVLKLAYAPLCAKHLDEHDAKDLADTGMNCPTCGATMASRQDLPRPLLIFVMECPKHGLFHFGQGHDITAGPPPSGA